MPLNMIMYRHLYDTQDGGPARAFECRYYVRIEKSKDKPPKEVTSADIKHCGKITKTENGMLAHLLHSHGIKLQKEIEYTPESDVMTFEQKRFDEKEYGE